MKTSIAITGSGIICALGTDKESVQNSLRENRTGIGELRYLQSQHKELPVGEVKMSDAELRHALCIAPQEEVSRTALLGAYALRQALEDASLSPQSLKGKRVTLISGTTVGGTEATEQYSCGNNTQAIARMVGVDCEQSTISTACSSALNAIILGTRMLLCDETDIVLAGGTEALSLFHLNGFNSLMILDHDVCRPFDATRQGLNLGEGAAYLVLQRTPDAHLQGSNIQAYITGWGNRCDAFHQTATSENGEGAFMAMTEALQMAHLRPEEIDYVNAHGTGTPDNDKSESTALRRVFAANMPPVSSTKSLTGHTTSASGSIEAVICLIAMQSRFIPANYGWSSSTPDCINPVSRTMQKELHHVLCNSFGFGGNDSSLIISDKEISLDGVPQKDYMLAGALAIHLGCHGYNITYSQGAESLQWALRDAQRLIREGKANSVLVGLHNHVPSTFKAVLDQQGITEPYEIYSKSIIIKSAL